MQQRPRDEGRHRSPFAAAFLSLLFPGLGQAYVGFYGRALAFAAPMILIVALGGGLLINPGTRLGLLAEASSPTTLLAILVVDLLLLAYRVVAIVDAFRLASAANAVTGSAESARLGRPRMRWHPVAIAGLLSVVLVASIAHVAVARYDLIAYDLVTSIGNGGDDENADATDALASDEPTDAGGVIPTDGQSTPPTQTGEPTAEPVAPSWNGKERLNILLLGVDKRGDQTSYNTDTMIVASIDPVTKQVAMLSLPRDTVNVPLPRNWRAYGFYGGVYPAKINSLWARARGQANLFPGSKSRERGFNALKGALGELYQIDIPYYIEVDFDGFKKIVDTFGGVAIDVQMPVADDHYPIGAGNSYNLYIPSGFQHMDGTQALAYARARHKTSDFDRAQRQQRVITSLRQQVDPTSLLEPGRLEQLVSALKSSIHTDIPAELFPALVGLAGQVDVKEVRSLVFTPPTYQVECLSCYSLTPKLKPIRRAVKTVFTVDKAFERTRVQLGEEAAVVWVLNGSGTTGQAANIADYLDYLGMDATVPTAGGGRADRSTYTQPVITVYNGAEADMTQTVASLEAALGVKAVLKHDPLVSADVIVITGAATPKLVPPD
ncbi:MAG TPA: LCP family protein [Candidatus Saccharimonadia bacterium]|nr:LCP family protein [Candidatus Saccharimonadia bacterium]